MRAYTPSDGLECYLVVPPNYRPQLFANPSFKSGTNLKAIVKFSQRTNENLIPLANGNTDVFRLGEPRVDVSLQITGADPETEQVIDEIIRRNIPVYIYPCAGGNLQLNLPLVRGIGSDPLDATVTYTLTTRPGTTIYMPHADSGRGFYFKAIDEDAPLIDGVNSTNGVMAQLPTGRGLPFFKKRQNLFLNSLISSITYAAPYTIGAEWAAYTSASDVWGTDHGIKQSPWCADANSYWTTSGTTSLRSFSFNTWALGTKHLSFCYRVDGTMNVAIKDSGGTARYSVNITTGSGRYNTTLSSSGSSYINAYLEVTLSAGSYCEFSCPQFLNVTTLNISEQLPFLGTTSVTVEAEVEGHSLKVEQEMGADILPLGASGDRNGAVLITGYVQPMWGPDYVGIENCIVQASGYDNNMWINMSYDGSSALIFDLQFGGSSRDTAAITGHLLGDIYAFGLWSGYNAGTAATRLYAVRLRDSATYTCDYGDSLMWLKSLQVGYELAGANQADAVISALSVQSCAWDECSNAVDRLADSCVRNIIRSTIGRWYKLSKATSPRPNDATINEGQYTGTQIRAI